MAQFGVYMSVLSIQSHVIHGHAGNKSATFPLQLLGFEVDPVNTVQFSNHTRYPTFTGEKIGEVQLSALFNGLEANGITSRYTHILSGYNSPACLKVIQKLVTTLKTANNSLLYVMDTVFGDNGIMYCDKACIKIYMEMCALADLITPNQFEAEILTDIQIVDDASARRALLKLQTFGVKSVVITSIEFGCGSLVLYGSCQDIPFKVIFPKIDGIFTGTGDFDSLIHACEMALGGMNTVLTRTREKSLMASERADYNAVRDRELCIIQSQDAIVKPNAQFQAIKFLPE